MKFKGCRKQKNIHCLAINLIIYQCSRERNSHIFQGKSSDCFQLVKECGIIILRRIRGLTM